MALLSVLQFPDPRLRIKAKPVTEFDSNLERTIDDMFETMYEQAGVGLAATQVDIHKSLIVLDLSDDKNSPLCVINPEIIEKEGTQFEHEGCLSFPGVYDKVERFAKIRFKALDAKGNPYEMDADNLLSVCIQHEMDHLNGILFIDHLSRLKQERMRKKLDKVRRQTL
jgi:peptide deformylase